VHLPHLLGRRVVLKPGEYFVSKQQVVISTLLGSCVAACLWDEPNKVIGMNHFLLANRRYARNQPLYGTEAGRYGVQAMELLINGMMKLGARRENLRAKVFGGASMMKTSGGDNFSCVGEVNTRFIVEFLVTDGIPLVSADLGGNVGRVIYFSSEDFSVHMRKMGRTKQKRIAQKEKGFWEHAAEEGRAVAEPEIWL
jgi:chemotaxis protein CheD